jgi:hypothetical protein
MYIYVYVETVYGDIPHAYTYTYTYTYVCIHIHIYMDIYIYICVCICTYIYIQISSPYPKLLPHQLPGPRAAGAASTGTSQATPGRGNCHYQVSHEKYLC